MRDERILKKLNDGDAAGLEGLMDAYGRYVSAVVFQILRFSMQAEDMEEVASDVFLTAWTHRADIRPGKIKAWLGAVARHKAKNKLRERGSALPLEEDALEWPDPAEPGRGERAGRGAGAGAPCRGRAVSAGPRDLSPPLLLRTDRGGGLRGHGYEPIHRQDTAAAGTGKIKGSLDERGVLNEA